MGVIASKFRYCWRLRESIPMLDERQWAIVEDLLSVPFMLFKGMHGTCGLDREQQKAVAATRKAWALDAYWEMTGIRLAAPHHLYYARNANYGSDCRCCCKPLRTQRARFCTECGTSVVTDESGTELSASL